MRKMQSWVWASKVAGKVIGSVAMSLTGAGELTITRLSIDPDYYHTRIVAVLLAQVRDVCALHHCNRIFAAADAMPGWLLKKLGKRVANEGIALWPNHRRMSWLGRFNAFDAAATIGGGTEFENRYGRDRWRSRSIISFFPLV